MSVNERTLRCQIGPGLGWSIAKTGYQPQIEKAIAAIAKISLKRVEDPKILELTYTYNDPKDNSSTPDEAALREKRKTDSVAILFEWLRGTISSEVTTLVIHCSSNSLSQLQFCLFHHQLPYSIIRGETSPVFTINLPPQEP